MERKLEAWPDIAKAVGLTGSQVMSAVVDVWGWRARLRLARGQTIADVTARIPAIESGLGTFRAAACLPDSGRSGQPMRASRAGYGPARRRHPVAWPIRGIMREPIDLGPFEDATPCRVLFLRRHALAGGTTGSGKSGWLNVLMGNLVACPDVVIWAIDLKKGMELKPWLPCIGRLATTPEQATALLRDAVAILQARAELLAGQGQRVWMPSPDMPALVIIIDEYAELADDAPDAIQSADSIARLGRAVAVTMVAATQRPTQKAMGQGAVRSRSTPGSASASASARTLTSSSDKACSTRDGTLTPSTPPASSFSAPEHTTPRCGRAYLINDQAVSETAARYAGERPELDDVSRHALGASSNPAGVPSISKTRTLVQLSQSPPTHTADGHGRGRTVVRPVHGPRGGDRSRRADSRHWNEPPHPVPALGSTCQGWPRGPGQPGPLARGHHRGASL